MAGIRFKLSTGDEVTKTVDSDDQAAAEVENFKSRSGDYSADWFPVDGGVWVLRSTVVSVGPVAEPFGGFRRVRPLPPTRVARLAAASAAFLIFLVVAPAAQAAPVCLEDTATIVGTSGGDVIVGTDRKSTRLNSSHVKSSYAV